MHSGATCEVAASSQQALLLDIAAIWSSEVETFPERFRGDRIHLTEAGHQEIARQLYLLWDKELARPTE